MSSVHINLNVKLQQSSTQIDDRGFELDVDISAPLQGVTVIFGHSGSGKTTLLRSIAGLQKSRGVVSIGGECWQDANHFVPTHRRSLGYVFQESGLLPHLNGDNNIQYGMKRAKAVYNDSEYKTIIQLMGIEHILSRLPANMSGGERQRVAIARALLIKPKILLMDEPLASLDQQRKQEIIPYLEKLKSYSNIPIFYVTHSIDEATRLADNMVVLHRGQCILQGKLPEILTQFETPLKLGEDLGTVLTGTVTAKQAQWHLLCAEFSGGKLWLRDNGEEIGDQVRIQVLARDVSLTQSAQNDTSILNILSGIVSEQVNDTHPAMCLTKVRVGEQNILARITHYSNQQLGLKSGSPIWVQIKSAAIVR